MKQVHNVSFHKEWRDLFLKAFNGRCGQVSGGGGGPVGSKLIGETILPGGLMIRLFKSGEVSQMHLSII